MVKKEPRQMYSNVKQCVPEGVRSVEGDKDFAEGHGLDLPPVLDGHALAPV